MKNRWFARLLTLLLVAAIAHTTVSLAVEPGSADDPLVTLSYLNDTFLTEIMAKVDQKIGERNAQLAKELSANGGAASSDTFTVVTLSKGQTLTGEIGCEVMLRVGTASCVAPSDPGLIDETAGGTLKNGAALTVNHLYMMTIDGRGVKAGAATVKLLVRGSWKVA